MVTSTPAAPTIGILALQGAFREHSNHLESLTPSIPLTTLLIRTPSDLSKCQALIIPGGESTAICLGAQRGGLLDPLRKWVRDGNPTWGTCAGMILLSQQATGGKKGGQQLIGGVDVRVGRNGWGSQVFSFETPLSIPCLSTLPSSSNNASIPSSNPPFNGVFIRAPIVEQLLDESSTSSSSTISNLSSMINSNQFHLPNDSEQGREDDGKVIEFNSQVENDPNLPSNLSSSGPGSGKDGDVLRMSFAPSLFPSSTFNKSSKRPPIQILASLEEIPQGASPIPSPKSIPISEKQTESNPSVNGTHQNSSGNENNENLKVPNRPKSDRQIVALRQGNIMITSFHPELTQDNRLHEYWVREMVLKSAPEV